MWPINRHQGQCLSISACGNGHFCSDRIFMSYVRVSSLVKAASELEDIVHGPTSRNHGNVFPAYQLIDGLIEAKRQPFRDLEASIESSSKGRFCGTCLHVRGAGFEPQPRFPQQGQIFLIPWMAPMLRLLGSLCVYQGWRRGRCNKWLSRLGLIAGEGVGVWTLSSDRPHVCFLLESTRTFCSNQECGR